MTDIGPLLPFESTRIYFSVNNLSLISRAECRSRVVFLMKDHHARRAYRLYDFTKSKIIAPRERYCVSGKVKQCR